MKNYFKKFSVMFVMSLILILGHSTSAFATSDLYTENLIPTMTSNNSPSGIVKCDTKWDNSDRWDGWKAFDRNNTADGDQWESLNTAGPHWISYEFSIKQNVCKYTLMCLNRNSYNAYMPQEWSFEGSNDDNNWDVLDTKKNEPIWNIGEKREYTFNNDTEYKIYRINATKNNSSSYKCIAIGEIEMMGKTESKSIALDKTSDSINVGETDKLTATTTPAGVGVTWTSSDSSIATVDSTGKVTGVKEGQATITATTADGLTATCVVNVTNKTVPVDPTPTESEYIVNTARAKGDNTNNASGGVSIIYKGVAEVQLSVVKTADVQSVFVGDNFTYTLVVTNTSSQIAKAVVINDNAPNHIQFTVSGVTTTKGKVDPSSTSNNIIVNVGDIPPSGTVTIKIPVTVIL